ncbi:AraC family transcriptional regulator [Paraglaciecola sp. T6c]|uniref:AraC family transcriptional regulator n=1 Tax=Pseudoalteromonas atlantica (strain T6c / ATCC BAA-1087) TaxID=3042615 RepID=UPI003463DC9C
MNRNKSRTSAFHFELSKPSGQLSAFVQGMWIASVAQPTPITKPLYSDAGSGIIFNFVGDVMIGRDTLHEGVIMLPINKQAQRIVLSPGAQLAGIRFHPAIGYGVLGRHYDKPTLLSPEQDEQYRLYQIYNQLRLHKGNSSSLEILNLWANKNLDFTNVLPDSLDKALQCIEQDELLGQLSDSIDLSQRQIERIFKLRLGMTPKYYQRILRIKKTIGFLRQHPTPNLADVAQQFGFSDQAHMTREFRAIACVTPKQV